ncbi:hypothetical protein GCM10010975_36310 [Comamonas phosphati]|nr:hypothetical protein GCM10010975_36310 [Comamonas phosphati]
MHQIHVAASCQAAPTFFIVRRARFALSALASLLAVVLAGPAHASCGSAFCSINTDWGAGTTGLTEGNTLDVRYENIRQDQPQTGSRKIAVGEIPHDHDEIRTLNRNLIAAYSHTWASGWGISATLPLVKRDHLHLHNDDGAQDLERWTFRELGDVRVAGRYQRYLESSDAAPRMIGVFFGLKLPTGRTHIANENGEVAERSLQPGTGTTDLIAGVIYHQQIASSGAAWFAQIQLQQPLNSHNNFRTGSQMALDLGYAHPLSDRLSGLVQLNTVVKRRDHGLEAEPADSGGRFLYLSPGLSYKLGETFRVYGYYQHPLHQDVNGVQLTAHRSVVVGVSTRF